MADTNEKAMKAIVTEGIRRTVYTTIPEPVTPPGWVKIKVHSVGLCSTDAHIIWGKLNITRFPCVMGHEICGDVVELGENCRRDVLGLRVVVETYVGCGKCVYCRTGRKHLCSAGEIGYFPYQGGNAQYVVVPESCIHVIPDSISYDEGGIMEAAICPFGAIMQSGLHLGHTILVQGAGVAGLSFIQAARNSGASKIICSVRSDERARLAERFGADVVIDIRSQDLVSAVRKETNGLGVDFSVDTVGTNQTLENSIYAAASGGKVILYALPDETHKTTIPLTDIIIRQITLCGYTGYEFAWDVLIDAVAAGRFNLQDMVSTSFPLKDYNAALQTLEHKPADLIKIVLHPWENA